MNKSKKRKRKKKISPTQTSTPTEHDGVEGELCDEVALAHNGKHHGYQRPPVAHLVLGERMKERVRDCAEVFLFTFSLCLARTRVKMLSPQLLIARRCSMHSGRNDGTVLCTYACRFCTEVSRTILDENADVAWNMLTSASETPPGTTSLLGAAWVSAPPVRGVVAAPPPVWFCACRSIHDEVALEADDARERE